jgi:hypothetical protein
MPKENFAQEFDWAIGERRQLRTELAACNSAWSDVDDGCGHVSGRADCSDD